jgi:multidrug efflux system membrane fusion protein
VNVRIKVETLLQATVIPTSAVQRGPLGTFSYVIGDGDIVTAKPVTVQQQDEKDAVIAKGVGPTDRVVTTGFANLSDGAKVTISQNDQAPTADLAPQKRHDEHGDRRGGDNSERRGKRSSGGGPKGRP